MTRIAHGNESDHIRRNPQDATGKVRGGRGDLVGDEGLQADEWDELQAEGAGLTESRIGDVGNAQSAILAGTGDLDRVHDINKSEIYETKMAAEDSPDLINPQAGGTPGSQSS